LYSVNNAFGAHHERKADSPSREYIMAVKPEYFIPETLCFEDKTADNEFSEWT
jgi:hypothetical protein